MTTLDVRSQQQIVELLSPLMTNEQDRRALLILTFINHPLVQQIDYTGAVASFVPTLVEKLYQFGRLDDGRPALWALLEVARERVGLDQKHRIDALRPTFELPPPPRLDRIFVSYSRQNERYAQRIVSDLKDAGLRVWFDREKIKGGDDWWQSIVRGISNADYFLFCLSPDSIRSKIARDELLTARQQGKTIFAVMLVNCLEELIKEDFADISWLPKLHIIDFTQAETYGVRLRELIQSLPGYTPPDTYFIDDYDPRDLPNPFHGLEAFLEVDAAYFFGRENNVQDLLARLSNPQRPRLLAVVGASGSGKSSLVRAGLIPAMRRALPFWETLTIKPGSHPLNDLADRLQERLGVEAERTRERLRGTTTALDDIAAELLTGKPAEARFVLVIDQFEELFTLTNDDERRLFLDLLLVAINHEGGHVQIILTMRADFFDRLSAVRELAKLVRDNLDIVTEMTPDQLRRSIEEPAKRIGVNYEEGLVEIILEDVRAQPGSLPLLQYALKALFERKIARQMTREAYNALGGVKGALATRAESIFTTLNPVQQEALHRVVLRLIDVGEETISRRRVARDDLHLVNVPDEVVQEVLERLSDAETRLLVVSAPLNEEAGRIFYEVSHEALMTHWERLATWIADNRDDLRRGSEILALANTWNETGRSETSYLLIGGRLATAREWLIRSDATDLQRDFVNASTAFFELEQKRTFDLQQRALNRTRLAAAIFALFLVVAVGLSFFAADRQQRAEYSAATSDANITLAVAAQATSVYNENVAGTQAAVAAFEEQRAQNNAATSDSNAATATVAQGQAQQNATISANNAGTAVANAITATIAQGEAQINATQSFNNAETAVANAATAEYRLSQAQSVASSRLAQQISDRGNPISALPIAFSANQMNNPPIFSQFVLSDIGLNSMLRSALSGHIQGVTKVAIHPSGSMLFTSSGYSNTSGELFVWDSQTGQKIGQLSGHTAGISDLDISENGRYVVSTSLFAEASEIIRWDLQTGDYIIFGNNIDRTSAVSINSDGTKILSGSWDGSLILWDVSNPADIKEIWEIDLDGRIIDIDINNNMNSALVANLNGYFNLIDIQIGKSLHEFEGYDFGVRTVVFHPSGRFAASASTDGGINIWDLATYQAVRSYKYSAGITSLDFNPDGNLLASGSIDGRVIVWDINSTSDDNHTAYIGHSESVTSVAFSSDGQKIISGTSPMSTDPASDNLQQVTFFQSFGNTSFGSISFRGQFLRFSYITKGQMVSIGDGINEVFIWDVVIGTYSTGSDTITSLAIDDNDSKLIIGLSSPYEVTGSRIFSSGSSGNVTIISQEGPQVLNGHSSGVTSVDINKQGTVAVSGSLDGSIIVWDMGNLSIMRQLQLQLTNTSDLPPAIDKPWVLSVSLSPSADSVLLGTLDGRVILYDITTANILCNLENHTGPVTSVAYSPVGRLGLSGGTDNKITIWDLDTCKKMYEMGALDSEVTALEFNSSGDVFASGLANGTVLIWDESSQQKIATLLYHQDAVTDLSFFHNDQKIISSSKDNTILMWSLIEFQPIHIIRHQLGDVLAITSTTHNLFSGGVDGILRSYPREVFTDMNQLKLWIRTNRYVSGLSCQEREDFQILPLCE